MVRGPGRIGWAFVGPICAGVAASLASLVWLLVAADGRALRRAADPEVLAWDAHPAAILALVGLGVGFLPAAIWSLGARDLRRGGWTSSLTRLGLRLGLVLPTAAGLVGAAGLARYELRFDDRGVRHRGQPLGGVADLPWESLRFARYEEKAEWRRWRRRVTRTLWLEGAQGLHPVGLSGLADQDVEAILARVRHHVPLERR